MGPCRLVGKNTVGVCGPPVPPSRRATSPGR
jgi:hypothetical protein